MYETKELVNAAMELKSEHDAQYAEDCVKGLLKQRKITTDQYYEVMKKLYKYF